MFIFETENQLKEFLILNERSNHSIENVWNMLKKNQIDDEEVLRIYKRIIG